MAKMKNGKEFSGAYGGKGKDKKKKGRSVDSMVKDLDYKKFKGPNPVKKAPSKKKTSKFKDEAKNVIEGTARMAGYTAKKIGRALVGKKTGKPKNINKRYWK